MFAMDFSGPAHEYLHEQCDDDLLRRLLLVLLCLLPRCPYLHGAPLGVTIRNVREAVCLVGDTLCSDLLVHRLGVYISDICNTQGRMTNEAVFTLRSVLAEQGTTWCINILNLCNDIIYGGPQARRQCAYGFAGATYAYLQREHVDVLIRVATSCMLSGESVVHVDQNDGTGTYRTIYVVTRTRRLTSYDY